MRARSGRKQATYILSYLCGNHYDTLIKIYPGASRGARRHRRALSLSCGLRARTRPSVLIQRAASPPPSPISPNPISEAQPERAACQRSRRPPEARAAMVTHT